MTLCQLRKQEQHWMAGWWNRRAPVESSNVLWDTNPAITWHDWEKITKPWLRAAGHQMMIWVHKLTHMRQSANYLQCFMGFFILKSCFVFTRHNYILLIKHSDIMYQQWQKSHLIMLFMHEGQNFWFSIYVCLLCFIFIFFISSVSLRNEYNLKFVNCSCG